MYNTTEDRGNPDYVKSNAPFLCSRNDAWLGSGYYFWDKDELRGHEWGKYGYKENYILGKSNLNLPDNLDLTGNVDDMRFMRLLLEELIENHEKFDNYDSFSDIPLGKAIEFLKSLNSKSAYKGVFDFDSIRAHDYPKDSQPIKFVEHRKEQLYLNPRVQICVIEKECIESYEIIYPEKYLL